MINETFVVIKVQEDETIYCYGPFANEKEAEPLALRLIKEILEGVDICGIDDLHKLVEIAGDLRLSNVQIEAVMQPLI